MSDIASTWPTLAALTSWPAWASATLLVDVVIAVSLTEVLLLWAWRRHTGRGVPLGEIGPNLLSGLMLMLALRSVLAAWSPAVMALFLLASGMAHAWDLWRRWQR
jgi:hypothetical protein